MLNVSFPRTVEAFQAHQQPSHAAFHETEFDFGETIEDAVKDQAGEGNHLAERVAERVHRLLADISERVRDQATATRFSLGA